MYSDLMNKNIYKLKRDNLPNEIFEAIVIAFPYPIFIEDEINPIILDAKNHLQKIYKMEFSIIDVPRLYSPNSIYAYILSGYLKYYGASFRDYFSKDVFYKVCLLSDIKYSKIGNKPFDKEKIYKELIKEDLNYKHLDYKNWGPEMKIKK